LYTQEWVPEGLVKGSIVLVHGLGEHSSRYVHVSKFFNQAGYAVFAFDLRGHGRSEGIRGHFSYDQGIADIDRFLDEAARRFPGKPIFLYGHSLGGAIALYYGFIRQPKKVGIISTAPGLTPAKPVSAQKKLLAKAMVKIFPAMTMNNDLDRSGLSHVPSVIEKYNADPLVHSRISAQLGLDLLTKGEWMLEQTSFSAPLHLLHSKADRLTKHSSSSLMVSHLTGNVTFREYEGLYHELHNEYEWDQVLGEILNWMESNLNILQ
jgi:alpha-beta hydrolase superfamily lysophospholipase